jgi:hypothetical protein
MAGGLAAARGAPGGRGVEDEEGCFLGRSWSHPRLCPYPVWRVRMHGMPARRTRAPTPIRSLLNFFLLPLPLLHRLAFSSSSLHITARRAAPVHNHNHDRPPRRPLTRSRSFITITVLESQPRAILGGRITSALHAHREASSLLLGGHPTLTLSPPNPPRTATGGHNTGPGSPQRVSIAHTAAFDAGISLKSPADLIHGLQG